jgi:hypothetical protein
MSGACNFGVHDTDSLQIYHYAAVVCQDTMRLACGLPVRNRREDDGPGMGVVGVAESSQDEVESVQKGLLVVHAAAMARMQQQNQDSTLEVSSLLQLDCKRN